MTQRIQVRRGTAAAATAANPVLAAGEFGFETDTGKVKIGDGATAWNSLPYIGGVAGAAADISYAGSTNLAATDVEAALDELDAEKKSLALDGAQLTTNATLTVNTSTDTFVPGPVEGYDTAGYHDTVTNNSRLTIPTGKAGKYLINGMIRYSANGTGSRDLSFYKNGLALPGGYVTLAAVVGGGITVLSHTVVAELAAGDYIQLLAYQNSGAALTVPSGWAVLTITHLGT